MSTPKTATAPAKDSGKRYSLTVSVVKNEQTPDGIKKQHSLVMESHNLALGETIEMQVPLADVLKGYLANDAE